jgi:hypothetical protein
MEKSVERALLAMQEQFSSLRKAFGRVTEFAKSVDATGLLFACHMLEQSFDVYETELVKFLNKEIPQ